MKARLLRLRDQRLSKEGVFVLKAQQYRTQEANRRDALERLRDWIALATHVPRLRKPTQPTRASRQRRLEGKLQRAGVKQQRSRVQL
jgi:ribosome-associated protein